MNLEKKLSELEIEEREPLVTLYYIEEAEIKTEHDCPCMGATTEHTIYRQTHNYFSSQENAKQYEDRLKEQIQNIIY